MDKGNITPKEKKRYRNELSPEEKLFVEYMIVDGMDKYDAYRCAFKPDKSRSRDNIMRAAYKRLQKKTVIGYMESLKEENELMKLNEIMEAETRRMIKNKLVDIEDIIADETGILKFWSDIMNSTSRAISITNRLKASEYLAKYYGMLDRPNKTDIDNSGDIIINISGKKKDDEDE